MNALDDVEQYINNTVKQVDHVAVDNFRQVKDEFGRQLQETEGQLVVTFDVIKEGMKFEELVAIVNSIAEDALSFNIVVSGNLKDELAIVTKNVTDIKDQVSHSVHLKFPFSYYDYV